MRSSTSSDQPSNVSWLSNEYVRRASQLLVQAAWSGLAPNASFHDLERRLHECANEAVRLQLEQRLCEIEDSFDEHLLVDGRRYRRHEPGRVEYHSLVGKVAVRRSTYREVGVRNGPTLVPLELVAGLIHRATPALAYSVAHGYAAGPMRHYEAQLKAAHRAPPPRATLERMAARIGGCAAQGVVKIEAEIRPAEKLPQHAHAVAVSLDRTSVAMSEERPPTAVPNSPRKRRTKPYQRRPPHPFDVNWRMVYVGTVSVVDGNGEVITTRKYHATPEEGPNEITTRMMADVVHCRSNKALPVVVVQDGAPEMWNEIRPALRRAGVTRWTEVIDRFHVNERLAAVLELTEREANVRREQLSKWQRQLERNDRAIYRICDSVWSRLRALPRGRISEQLAGHHGYLSGYARMMKYASLRRLGLPIASGAVEGACKSLVMCRAKRSGQRWKQDGLTAALTLRSLDQSDRLPRFWDVFARRFLAEIRAAA
jgi:hypothetical protein